MTPPAPTSVLLCAGMDGVGPAETCYRICREWPALGRRTEIHATRLSVPDPAGIVRPSLPRALGFLPLSPIQGPLARRAARACVDSVREGDLVYAWPSAPVDAVAAAKERGATVVVENINTFTGWARTVLDRASEAIGAPPQHTITDQWIEEELRRLSLADFVFAPNAFVEESLRQTGITTYEVLPTSYGAYLPQRPARTLDEPTTGGRRLRFLFVGLVCVRKGAHRLLEAWREARIPGELVICGTVDPFVAERYAEELADPSVHVIGFQPDIDAQYASADVFVFPSLEEGGPQVCYEAAAHGLPQITTAIGGGRIARDGRNALVVEPDSADALAGALRKLAADAELRHELGITARRDAREFAWPEVAARRHELLVQAGC